MRRRPGQRPWLSVCRSSASPSFSATRSDGLEGVLSPRVMGEPAKPLGTTRKAETWPPAVALAVVSAVAPKLTSTGSEGPNPRQARVTRDPADPVLEEGAAPGSFGMAPPG